MGLRLEYTVEPFVEGAPGPHVTAALEAASAAGLDVEFGPFGTTVAGAEADVLSAGDRIVRAAIGAGASRVSLQVVRA
ncbi:MAG TPA: thiamine-binding protein [Acidimicrobiales bacterium]|nr:thiamine-binding protein [Acidimicrobiales bacterium]